MDAASRLVHDWYEPKLTALTFALTPLSVMFASAAALRRALYRLGVLHTQRIAVPVIVVGNITAGGSGKTPLVTALAHELRARGLHPGIVSRGYGRHPASNNEVPMLVSAHDDP